MTKSERKISDIYISILTALLILFPVLTVLLSYYSFYFDIFSHFQLQFATVWLICAILLITFRYYWQGAALLFFVATFSIPMITPTQFIAEPEHRAELYFMNVNAFKTEEEYLEIANYVSLFRPSKVAIVESPDRAVRQFEALGYTEVIRHEDGPLSCAIFSDEQPINAMVIEATEYPICYAQFQDYHLIVIHPIPPLSPDAFETQKIYFTYVRSLIEGIEEKGDRFILVGDFNSTAYSQLFLNSFREYHKINNYSWNSGSLFTIPIDHAMANFDIGVTMGDQIVSDHRGLFVRISPKD